MNRSLDHVPAWVLAGTYAGASLAGVVIVGGPSDGGAGLWTSGGVFASFVGLVIARGRLQAQILGTAIGTTAAIALFTDVFSVPQPWRGIAALVLMPLLVYLVCDRGERDAETAD